MEEVCWLPSESEIACPEHSLLSTGLSRGGISKTFLLLLPVLATACVFSAGIGLWAVGNHFLTADIPAAVGHPVKLQVLCCFFQLLVTRVSFVFYLSAPSED